MEEHASLTPNQTVLKEDGADEELHVRQVEDRAVPAAQVLREQQAGIEPGVLVAGFVP